MRRKSSTKGKKKNRLDSRFPLKVDKTDWEWYEPAEDSAPVHFFANTSLHGLRYLGQRKRHLCERIFWLVAFIAAVICSGILIWHMWDNYKRMPIVTVFNPTEKTLDKIPFPSVTICSVNNIKKSKWDEYERNTELGLGGAVSNETFLQSLANMLAINNICKSGKTFTQKFYTYNISYDKHIKTIRKHVDQFRHLVDPSGSLHNSSQSCEDMILFCLWLDTVTNCTELFQQVETDYGRCCTFNMIPLSLLRTYVKNNLDDPERVKDWKEADLHPENLVLEDEHIDRKYPYRQLYPGRSAGLSVLVDANMEEYHCTNTDSDGFAIGLNMPLDFPRMRDNGIAVRSGTEVFLSVRPDITMSAESARKASFEKRHCFFDGEKNLTHYTKYTASNCLDECIAKETLRQCECLRYYMPGHDGIKETRCRAGKYNCTEYVKAHLIREGLDKMCNNCWPSCTEIKFHTDLTSLRIREKHITELLKHYPDVALQHGRAKHASIIHIYYNVDSVFPRLRKEMFTVIELISNAGGLLGLCMGFSMLSLLEILYHVTIRLFCNAYRERCNEVEELQKFNTSDTNYEHLNNSYGSTKGSGFLANVFGRGPRVHDNQSVWEAYDNGGGNIASPIYFRTPFVEDFQRTFIATTWAQSKPLLDIDNDTVRKPTVKKMGQQDFANDAFHY